MEKDVFKNNQDLKEIYKVETAIKAIYDLLMELEVSSKKNTLEYSKLTNKLKQYIFKEEELLSKIDVKLASKLLNILSPDICYGFEDYFYSIYEKNDIKIIKARLIYKLESIINNTSFEELEEELEKDGEDDSEEDTFLEEMDEELTIEDIEDIYIISHEHEQDFIYMNNLQDAIEEDIISTILKIMNDYINDREYENIKFDLIKYKYIIGYVFPYFEHIYLRDNFKIDDTIYWKSKLVVDYYKGNEELYNIIKSGYIDSLLYEHCDNLLDLMLFDLKEEENLAHAISSQIVIRSCLMFADTETCEDYICLILDGLKELGIANNEVESIIKNSFQKIDSDKQLPLILSFKPNKKIN